MWESRRLPGEIPKGLVGRGESPLLAFHLSTAPAFPQLMPFPALSPRHAGVPPSAAAWFSVCCFCLACSTR
jgi:hypothetical protein